MADNPTDAPHVLSLTRPHLNARADDLTTKREIAGVFVSQPSARALFAAITALVAARVSIGDTGRGDLIAPVVTIALTGTVEWVIHRHLLHAPADAWTSRVLGLGAGHRRHHMNPAELRWLLLSGVEASVFVVALGVVTAAWALPLMSLIGSATLGPFLTAWTCAAIALLHYEWVHLLVHTRYRPTSRHYRRLARHHRLHHFRNERYWLGVTSTTGDWLLRTPRHHGPRPHGTVELSPTARTLGTTDDLHHSGGNRHGAR